MFDKSQRAQIATAINGTWQLANGSALSESALFVFLDDVSGYPFDAVMTAIARVRRQGKKMTSGDVMRHLDNMDGRPSTEESWGIASQVLDEQITVIWTTEMAAAWDVAQPLLEMGDRFSAARAYKERYASLVEEARLCRVAVHWTANIGTDASSRQRAIEEAVAQQKISAEQAVVLLPSYAPDAKQVYAAIEQQTQLRIENKTAPVTDRVAELRAANEAMRQRKAEAAKQAEQNQRPDGTKSRRDSMAIFEIAEQLQVFTGDAERRDWAAKAAAGEDMRELQRRILLRKASAKAGAA